MAGLNDFAEKKLASLTKNNQLRVYQTTERSDSIYLIREGKHYISFACNDYLGLTHHPKLKVAAIQAVKQYGTGAGSSRLITGNSPFYAILESQLASIKQTEAALVFGSGYLANLGVISALAGPGDLIIADKYIHASMIDAAQLSGATFLRFAHNNLKRCEKLLAEHRAKFRHCLILTETVFSMDGDLAPVEKLLSLAEQYDSWLVSDDAHGFGVTPSTAFPHERHIQMGTLSKSIGAYGGYACATKIVVELLANTARSAMFTTALPPAVLASAAAAIKLIRTTPGLVEMPLRRARLFAQLTGLPRPESAIVPYIIGDSQKALDASLLFAKQGLIVPAIRPPSVPKDTARLRFTFSASHTENHVRKLAQAFNAQFVTFEEPEVVFL